MALGVVMTPFGSNVLSIDQEMQILDPPNFFSRNMCIGTLRGVAVDVSTVHDFRGSADNPTLNGTLRHQDLDLALYQRARAKVDKYREGYAAQGLRHAFLPAIVSTSGRIHGELLRLLFNLADKKTSNSLRPLVRPSMLNLRFIAGVGVGISGGAGGTETPASPETRHRHKRAVVKAGKNCVTVCRGKKGSPGAAVVTQC